MTHFNVSTSREMSSRRWWHRGILGKIYQVVTIKLKQGPGLFTSSFERAPLKHAMQ